MTISNGRVAAATPVRRAECLLGTIATMATMATGPTGIAAQDSPCVSQPEYTLDAEVPGLIARDSSRAAPIQGGGLILTETVRVGSGPTLTIVGRSCLSYVVEYRLALDPSAGSSGEALVHLRESLNWIESYNRAPVPLGALLEIMQERARDLLAGEAVALSGNPLGETVRIAYESGTTPVIRLIYVVGL